MLNNKLAMSLLALACGGLSVGSAGAASVKLTGSIEPTTCALTLGDAASTAFAYGDISPSSLSSTAKTALAVQSIALKVTCDAPTRVAIGAIDNKAGSNPFTTGTVDMSLAGGSSAGNAVDMFGLGKDGTANIGAYSLALTGLTLDAAASIPVVSQNLGVTWGSTTDGFIGGAATKYWRSWAKTGGTQPLAGTTFEAMLKVQPWIDAKSNLALTKDIVLSGSATIELHYL